MIDCDIVFLKRINSRNKLSKIISKRIIGVDPGTNVLGFAILEVKGKQMKVLELGVVTMHHLESHQQKLKRIFERLQELIKNHRPHEMAIEAPFYGKNVQSMLKLGRAQGVAIAAAVTNDVPITEYAPKKIKLAITGNGNSSKEQVAAMLKNMVAVELKEYYLDATDALAAAICHHYQSRLGGGGKKYGSWKSFVQANSNRVKS